MEFKVKDLERVAIALAIEHPNQVILEKDVIAEAKRLHLGKPLRKDNNE